MMRVQVDVVRRIAALVGAITLLTACSSGDIVVKTDLDEKYIVKESAVTKIDIDWEEIKSPIKKYQKDWAEHGTEVKKEWHKCLGKDGSFPLSASRCRRLYGDLAQTAKDGVERNKNKLKDLDRLMSLQGEIATKVRYRPIFIGVNNEKSALGYATSTCLNTSVLGSEDSERLFEIMGQEEDTAKKKRTSKESAYLSVSKEVCDKYAHPGTVKFIYSIDEDQDKDKKE